MTAGSRSRCRRVSCKARGAAASNPVARLHGNQRASSALEGNETKRCGQVKWLLYALVAIPLYLAGEAFFGWFLSEDRGRKISSKTFSPARILFALPFAMAAIAVFYLVRWLIVGGAS